MSPEELIQALFKLNILAFIIIKHPTSFAKNTKLIHVTHYNKIQNISLQHFTNSNIHISLNHNILSEPDRVDETL